jgi:hypothetical protein
MTVARVGELAGVRTLLHSPLDEETCGVLVEVLVALASVMRTATGGAQVAEEGPDEALHTLLAYTVEALEMLALEQRRRRGDATVRTRLLSPCC